MCPHDPKDPRHAQAYPDHPRTSISDEIIAAALARFADQYLLGHDRAAMLQVQLPAGDAELAEQRDHKAAALRKQLAKIQTAQNGLLAQAERLGDDTRPAAEAMRDRIYAQYTQRHDQHAALAAELEALTIPTTDEDAGDPALLDELPYAPGLLSEAPAATRQAICAAFDIHCLYRHDQGQVTIWATITDTTPGIIQALLNDPRTGTTTAATSPAEVFADLMTAATTTKTADKPGRGRWGMAEASQPDGARLRLARPARCLAQQQLVGLAGVTGQAASAVESGHSDPSLRVALGLAGRSA